MRIDIVARPDMAHQVEHAEALAEGLKRHACVARIVASPAAANTDVVACWGWRIGRELHRKGHDVLVMERGYIGDRMQWTSLGWNGLNGRASFARPAAPSRFRKYFADLLRPERRTGDIALIIGQVNGDASLDGVDIDAWYATTAARAAHIFGLPVSFRPHPVSIDRKEVVQVPGAPRLSSTLEQAIELAAVVITWNSNAGVEAALAGKPVVAFDRCSMAWEVASHDLSIERFDREAWAQELAYAQWSRDEIASGEAWEHVRTAL